MKIAAVALFLVHAAQTVRAFPGWSSIVDDRPILQVDHALHLYHGWLGSQFLAAYGTNWGYDPFFMAGYPKTPFHDPSSGLADVCQLLAGATYSPRSYKLGLLFTMLTTPVLLGWGSRLIGLEPRAVLVGTALALAYYWAGFPRVLLDSGLYSFLWGCAWVVFVLGAASAWHRDPGVRSALLLTVVTVPALFVHPTVVVMLALSLPLFYLAIARQHGWRWHAALAAAAAVVLAANSFWWIPMLRLLPLRQVQFIFLAAPPDEPLFVLHFYRDRLLAGALVVLGFAALGLWLLRRQWLLLGTLGLFLSSQFLLTFWGSLWEPTRGLEPLRFQVPLHLSAGLAAGDLLVRLGQRLVGLFRRGRLAAASLLLLAGAMAVWCAGGPIRRELRLAWTSVVEQRPFPVGFAPPMQDLIDWIGAHTDDSARILLEDQLRLREPTVPESLHWTCLLPILTGRQFIGGQYQTAPLLHHHASFGDFHLGGRPIVEYSTAGLAEFLERYNVGWVICWSPQARAVFDSYTAAERLALLPRFTSRPTENRYAVYRIDRRRSFFAAGSGQVSSVGLNRIELRNLVPADGRIVLRYHWLETLRSDPDVPLEPVTLGTDPVGFVGLRSDRPIERLVIDNSYRWR